MDTKTIISELTLEEKAGLLTGYGAMETMPVERCGIASMTMTDGPHGVRLDEKEGGNSTYFPSLCALGSSWDRDAARRMGEALGGECRYHKKDMLLGPGINMKRHILCGRNFEYLSEDPVLAGELAAAYIQGVQEEGVSACLKHLAANNQESDRLKINVEADERTLREIYLRAFEIAIQKGKPDAVMCAYNKVNAVWCSENRFLLTEILREEWGYNGLVVSDWGAVHHGVRAVRAGMDLIMPRRRQLVEEIRKGLADKTLTEEELNQAAERVVEWSRKEKKESKGYDRFRQHEEAVKIASESMVLLKNDRQALPMTREKCRKIAVFGEYAVNPLIGGQGSAEVYPEKQYIDSPLECLKAALPETEIKYMELYQKSAMPSGMLWPRTDEFREFTKDCDTILFFAGEMESESTENFDRRSAQLNPNMEFFIELACRLDKKVIVVLQSGGALILNEWRTKADAIVQMWLSGEGGGRAIADILTGRKNPCGKLAETFPVKMRSDIDFGNEGKVVYREGLETGYRYYDHHPEEIVYPFGHGLSYTSFQYTGCDVRADKDCIEMDVSVGNTGEMEGQEVIQIYIGQCSSVVSRPVKELKAFEKISLKPGEEKTITVRLPVRELGYYNIMLHDWTVEEGNYRIYIGASSQDIRLQREIYLDGDMAYSVRSAGEAMVG